MEPENSLVLHRLVHLRLVATLATLHRGEPAASMVPFAVDAVGGDFIVHVSQLATHTRDMQDHAGVSLLVVGELPAAQSPLALPRLSVQGVARRCTPDEADYEQARSAYLDKLPDAADLFAFGDFSLWRITPQFLRLVAGFGRAYTLTAAQYLSWLSTGGPAQEGPRTTGI